MKQEVIIDGDWKISRSDPSNWQIKYRGKRQGFYGTIQAALKALPAKMLNEEARGTLTDILRRVQGIYELIDKAIP